jgi:putative phage-type endonuclease
MKQSQFKLTLIPKERSEWLALRQQGLGGSEVAAILGLNPYQCSLEVFRRKIGVLPIEEEDNLIMFMGRKLEPLVAELWEYWEGDANSVLHNATAGRKVRNCLEVKHRIVNNDYPHLFAHLDRMISESGLLHDAQNGVLELKTINGFAVKQWEDGIPIYHKVQLQTYLLITGLEYGEVAMLVDGRRMEVIRFERDEAILAEIAEKTALFWDSVLIARSILAHRGMTEEQKFTELERLEPKPDSSEAWEKFLKAQYQGNSELPVLQGSDELLEYAREYHQTSEKIKELEETKAFFANQIRYYMGDHEVAEFEGNGKITWKAAQGKSRTLRIGLKHFEFAS